MSVATSPDIAGDLLRVHAIITRALGVSADYCAAAATGRSDADSPAHEGFFTYTDALASYLHSHHLTEDEIAFPYFREKVPDMPYDRLAEDHRLIAAAIDEIVHVVAIGRAGDRERAKQDVGRILVTISTIWPAHIGEEEKYVTRERLDAVVSSEEQTLLNERIMEHVRTHAVPDYLVVPFVLYNLPAPARAVMAGKFPPVVTEQLVPVVWAGKWSPMKPFLLD